MTTKTTTENQPSATAPYVINSVTSKDGTVISYRQLGQGPGLVILHGIMESAQSHMQLAQLLADTYTVYLPDRRGRGLSGTYGDNYHMQKEVEDLDALLTKTDTHYVFGVSMGAVISLESARLLPTIRKVAVYDPPLVIDNSVPTDFVARYDQEIAGGETIAALVTAMKGAQMGPPIFNALPDWLLKSLTNTMVKSEEKKAQEGDVTMRMLAPTLHYEFQLAKEMQDKQESFKAIRGKVLLLGSGKSAAYFHIAVSTLEKVLPNAKCVRFPALTHAGSGNANQRGKPGVVAKELRQFFAGS